MHLFILCLALLVYRLTFQKDTKVLLGLLLSTIIVLIAQLFTETYRW